MQIVPSGFHSRKTFSCKERLLCNEKFVVFFSFLYNFLLRYETPHVERPCVLFFFYYHYFIFNFFKRKLKLSHRDGTECTALRIPNRRTIRQIFTAFSSPSIKLPSKRSVSVKKIQTWPPFTFLIVENTPDPRTEIRRHTFLLGALKSSSVILVACFYSDESSAVAFSSCTDERKCLLI